MNPSPDYNADYTDPLKDEAYGYGAYHRSQESAADQFARKLQSVVGVNDLMAVLDAGYEANGCGCESNINSWADYLNDET